MTEQELALEAIRKKLLGKPLTYKEIYAIMDEIAHQRFNTILTTYFAASGYSKGFTNEELYSLTKAMVETGEKLHFRGIVADKHSIGGVPGTRTTLIVIPIIAAAGFIIPKSSSRAITTPDGTADDMEILASVNFTKEQLYEIVRKTGGCIVWGGSFNIAPADDILITVEKPLMFESFDKILVSIMAKKIAFGANHVIIDLPYGDHVKVHKRSDALILKEKFEYLAKKFSIHLTVLTYKVDQPLGKGIGPVLETREALCVLEQTKDRPLDLEEHALMLAGTLLDLCLIDCPKRDQEQVKKLYGSGRKWAEHILTSGVALQKMHEIILAQGGKAGITSTKLKPGKYLHKALAGKNGRIKQINSQQATIIAKILGAPKDKGAGIYLEKKMNDHVTKGETLFMLYSENMYNLKEARDSLQHFPVIAL